jgi:hypothetical protein
VVEEQPAENPRQGQVSAASLEEYEGYLKALLQDGDERAYNHVIAALEDVENDVTAVLREAEASVRAADRDARIDKQDYENTVKVLKEFPERLQQARKGAESLVQEGAVEVDDLNDEEAYRDYLKKIMPRLKKRLLHFAFGLGKAAQDHRFLFDPTRNGQHLALTLKEHVGMKKLTWGLASALEGDERTVALQVEAARRLPGLARNGTALLHKLGGLPFSRVVIVVDGVVVDDLPDADEGGGAVAEAHDAAPLEPHDPQFLAGSWKKLKGGLVPMIHDTLARTNSHKAEIQALLVKAIEAEKEGRLGDAIHILRDQLVPHLNAARRDLADGERLVFDKLKTRPTDRMPDHDGSNRSLAAALQGLGRARSGHADPRAFFDGARVTGAEATTREWAINYAALQHFAAGLEPGPARQALEIRSVSYLNKFANIPNSRDLNWQSTPVQLAPRNQQEQLFGLEGVYHRSGGSQLYAGLRDHVADTLNLPPDNVFLASDPRVMEAVARDFTTRGSAADFLEGSDDQLDAIIDAAAMNRRVFVDVTRLVKDAGDAQNKDTACKDTMGRVMTRLEARCRRLAAERCGVGDPADLPADLEPPTPDDQMAEEPWQELIDDPAKAERRELAKKKYAMDTMAAKLITQLQSQVVAGAVVNVSGQTALCIRDFHELKAGTTEYRVQAHLETKIMFQEILNHNGFTAGPNQLVEQWLQGAPDAQSVLRKLKVQQPPDVHFPKDAPLAQFNDLENDFLKNDKVQAFAALAAEASAPSYLQVMPKTILKLIDGLGKEGVPQAVAESGLGQLYQLSLNRMLGFMEQAVAAKDDFSSFLNLSQLIMEEISTLLALAQPYKLEGFGQEMAEVTELLPADFPMELAPKFSRKNSATRCFASVLTGLEDMKQQKTGKRGLNIAVQGDSYYEPSAYVLHEARDHKSYAFDTEKGTVGKDDEGAQIAGNDAKKLECYLCEFHHYISYTRKSYKPEDVTAQVRKLVDDHMVADPFTVIIDTTIAKTDAPELKQFLDAFQKEIEDGLLNVVIYRSAQKFDQMGMDNYNGAIMARINNGSEKFAAFNDSFDNDRDAISSQNVQGITHYNKHAQEELNAYRAGIMANTAKLGAEDSTSPIRFPPEMLRKDENAGKSALQIAVNEDENAPFIDIKFPGVVADSADASLLYGSLLNNVIVKRLEREPDKYPASIRASFGFPHTNFTLIGNAKLRFNPGLENDEILGRYRDLLVDTNNVLTEARGDFEAMGLDLHEVNARLGSEHLLNDDVIKDISAVNRKAAGARTMEDYLLVARRWIEAENPRAALRALQDASAHYPSGTLDLLRKKLLSIFSDEKDPLERKRVFDGLEQQAVELLLRMAPTKQ